MTQLDAWRLAGVAVLAMAALCDTGCRGPRGLGRNREHTMPPGSATELGRAIEMHARSLLPRELRDGETVVVCVVSEPGTTRSGRTHDYVASVRASRSDFAGGRPESELRYFYDRRGAYLETWEDPGLGPKPDGGARGLSRGDQE